MKMSKNILTRASDTTIKYTKSTRKLSYICTHQHVHIDYAPVLTWYLRLMSAPACSSTLTLSVFPLCDAQYRAVAPPYVREEEERGVRDTVGDISHDLPHYFKN